MQWLCNNNDQYDEEIIVHPDINNAIISKPMTLTEQLRNREQHSPTRVKNGEQIKLW